MTNCPWKIVRTELLRESINGKLDKIQWNIREQDTENDDKTPMDMVIKPV